MTLNVQHGMYNVLNGRQFVVLRLFRLIHDLPQWLLIMMPNVPIGKWNVPNEWVVEIIDLDVMTDHRPCRPTRDLQRPLMLINGRMRVEIVNVVNEWAAAVAVEIGLDDVMIMQDHHPCKLDVLLIWYRMMKIMYLPRCVIRDYKNVRWKSKKVEEDGLEAKMEDALVVLKMIVEEEVDLVDVINNNAVVIDMEEVIMMAEKFNCQHNLGGRRKQRINLLKRMPFHPLVVVRRVMLLVSLLLKVVMKWSRHPLRHHSPFPERMRLLPRLG